MIPLSDLFTLINGISKPSVPVFLNKISSDSIRFLRPSKTFKGTFNGYINRADVPKGKLFPSETIFVSTNGQGSHTYAYVSAFEFVPNSDVTVLIPKKEMNLIEKQYYARCITQNRFKFSYGRKPKGNRLKNLSLPDRKDIPIWALDFKYVVQKVIFKKAEIQHVIETSKWNWFSYNELFIPERGRICNISNSNNKKGLFPIISASTNNNGVVGYLNTKDKNIFAPNCITIANTGQGSVGFPSFQEKAFYATNNITVLKPKFVCNKYIGIFLCTLIKKDRYKYSYGRILNDKRIKEAKIKLPVDKMNNPDWKFMKNYIKKTKFASYI